MKISTQRGQNGGLGGQDGSKMVKKSAAFYPILSVFWVSDGWISVNFRSLSEAWEGSVGLFDPPEAKVSTSRFRRPILRRFWKIDFLTIFDPIWSPRPPILTPLGTKFHGKMSKFRQNTRFWGLRTRETPSTARGSSNEIARGEKTYFRSQEGILGAFWPDFGSLGGQILPKSTDFEGPW